MCYAIPGKVVSTDGKTATIEYFGELRKANIIGRQVQKGDYVYAQGGVVIGTVPEEDALSILEFWKGRFFKLKEVDDKMSKADPLDLKPGELTKDEMLSMLSLDGKKLEAFYAAANSLRKERLDNACCVHGILEFSNVCLNDCLYCGIRCSNKKIKRYSMTEQQIIEAADHSIDKLGFKALVLQSGDTNYSDDMLVSIVEKIRSKHDVLLFMSVGERSIECYQRLYDAGAYGTLLRFETSNPNLYSRMRPGKQLRDRLDLIRGLKRIGFIVATGFIIGLPGQTKEDLVNDILLTKSLAPDMYSFGPLIPHPDTPLSSAKKPTLDEVLKVIALSRFTDPESKILVTTALETISKDAKTRGLLAGANSLMINTTPSKYRECYDLYPGKVNAGGPAEQAVKETVDMLRSLGRAPTDLGV